ncbi:MAG: HPF/RaiA family ribosome-associated protein [Candidatus Rokubacteria bacterium]|nr:HPF/RaiA family ribosome-associated protein [Candidatus Rokubacteria bacterium]
MSIEISGIDRNVALRRRVERQIGAALGPLRVAPVKALVSFFDDNGPKGGLALRCAVTVRVPYRPAIRVENTAATARVAFDGALGVLERQLERYRERDRDVRRRPKKYFAAKRLLGGG